MKTAFLLGAGASKHAGLPLAPDITGQVLGGEPGKLKRLGDYHPELCASFGSDRYASDRIPLFLRWIKAQVELCQGREANYEDIAYMAAQIVDHLSGEFDNPAILPLIEKALSEAWFLLPDKADGSTGPRKNLSEQSMEHLAKMTLDYIRDVVWRALAQSPDLKDLDYLRRFIVEIPHSCNEGALNVFSLNNDTLIEQFLLNSGRHFIDGFDPLLPAEGKWKPALFEQSVGADTIRLFKLHGSVNWFRHRPDGKTPRDEFRRIRLGDAALQEYRKRPPANRPEDLPEILVGTFNKMLQYTGALYLPLHYWFYRELETTDALVVCGYSFGDKGINQRLVHWLTSKRGRKIVVVSPNAKDGSKKARGAIAEKWPKWIREDKLRPHTRAVESTNRHAVWRKVLRR